MPRLAWGQEATPGAAGVTFQPNPLAPPPASPGAAGPGSGTTGSADPEGERKKHPKFPFFSTRFVGFFFFYHGGSAEAQPALFPPLFSTNPPLPSPPRAPRFPNSPFFVGFSPQTITWGCCRGQAGAGGDAAEPVRARSCHFFGVFSPLFFTPPGPIGHARGSRGALAKHQPEFSTHVTLPLPAPREEKKGGKPPQKNHPEPGEEGDEIPKKPPPVPERMRGRKWKWQMKG